MIRDGRPYTDENGWVDDSLITSHPEEEQERVFQWIRSSIVPRSSENTKRTSYGIKHILENDTGIYLTNNEFKDAMMICGFMPVRCNDCNWKYRISEMSPAFKRKTGR